MAKQVLRLLVLMVNTGELRKISVIELFTVKRVNHFWNIREKESYEGKQFEGYYKFQEAIGGLWAADFFPKFGWILDGNVFPEGLIDEHLDPDRPRPEHKDIIDVLLEISKDETPPIHRPEIT
ncbi:Cytochrome [Forsythia ovata]|uniref:Cytochrome n=1 Tax=Forsythia ovata TaxID=205694 RepID=A0ABD1RKS2_9LAMI